MNKVSMEINLNTELLGFNKNPMVFQDGLGNVRNMTIRDALQLAVSSFPPKQDFKILYQIHNLIPKLSDSNDNLTILELEEKDFLCESVKQTETINAVAKSFILFEVLKKTL